MTPGKSKPRKRNPAPRRAPARKTRPSNVAAVATRMFVVWPAKAVGGATRAVLRHGGATAGRVGKSAYAGMALHAEAKRAHGGRAVVRDVTDPAGRPLSLSQVSARLLGLETARARAEGHPDPAWARRLTRSERWQLWRQGEDHTAWWTVHQAVAKAINAPALGPVLEPSPPTTSVAVSGGRAPVDLDRLLSGGKPVIEPRTFDDLANPAIEQENWQEELPQHFRATVGLFQRTRESISAYVEYHREGKTEEGVLNALADVLGNFDSATQAMQNAAGKAEEWVNSMQLPQYDKAG